jgi:hypothetical protein
MTKQFTSLPADVFPVIQLFLSTKHYRNLLNTSKLLFEQIKYETIHYSFRISAEKTIDSQLWTRIREKKVRRCIQQISLHFEYCEDTITAYNIAVGASGKGKSFLDVFSYFFIPSPTAPTSSLGNHLNGLYQVHLSYLCYFTNESLSYFHSVIQLKLSGLSKVSSLFALSGPNILLQELTLSDLPILVDIESLRSLLYLKVVKCYSCAILHEISALRNIPMLYFNSCTFISTDDLVTSLVGNLEYEKENVDDVDEEEGWFVQQQQEEGNQNEDHDEVDELDVYLGRISINHNELKKNEIEKTTKNDNSLSNTILQTLKHYDYSSYLTNHFLFSFLSKLTNLQSLSIGCGSFSRYSNVSCLSNISYLELRCYSTEESCLDLDYFNGIELILQGIYFMHDMKCNIKKLKKLSFEFCTGLHYLFQNSQEKRNYQEKTLSSLREDDSNRKDPEEPRNTTATTNSLSSLTNIDAFVNLRSLSFGHCDDIEDLSLFANIPHLVFNSCHSISTLEGLLAGQRQQPTTASKKLGGPNPAVIKERKKRKIESISLRYLHKIRDFSPINGISLVTIDNCRYFNDGNRIKDCQNIIIKDCDSFSNVSMLGNVHSLMISSCQSLIHVYGLYHVPFLRFDNCHNLEDISHLEGNQYLVFRSCEKLYNDHWNKDSHYQKLKKKIPYIRNFQEDYQE